MEPDFHLPATRHGLAKTKNIPGLAIGPGHASGPSHLSSFLVERIVPSRKPALEVHITVPANQVLGSVRVVVIAIVQRIHHDLDRVVFPKVGVWIVAVDHVIPGLNAHVQIVVIMRQPERKTRIVRSAPNPVRRVIQNPGARSRRRPVAYSRSDIDSLKPAVLSGGNGPIERDRSIGNLWDHESGFAFVGPLPFGGRIKLGNVVRLGAQDRRRQCRRQDQYRRKEAFLRRGHK